jgi:hypothetical protein
MAGYRIISLFQSVAGLFLALTVFDFAGVIGLNAALNFGMSPYWTVYTFWGYIIALIAILQVVKAFIVRERD